MEDERSSDEILRDIERTRGAMDETLDELGQRLHPRQLLDDAVDLFRSDSEAGQKFRRTTRHWGRRAADEVRSHPLPALLVGAGLAWMLFNTRDEEPEDLVYPEPEDYTHLYEPGLYREGYPMEGEMASSGEMALGAEIGTEYDSETLVGSCRVPEERNPALGEEIEQAITEKSGPGEGVIAGDDIGRDDQEAHGKIKRAADAAAEKARMAGMTLKEKAMDTSERVRHGASRSREAVADAARAARGRMAEGIGHARQGVRSRVEHAREGVGDMRYRAAERTRRMQYRTRMAMRENIEYGKEQFEMAVDEYPMALGAGALALGILAGIAMPRTRAEDQTIGRKADEAKRMAKKIGEEVFDRGKETAAAAAAAAANQLQREGLMPEDLMAKGQRVVDETKEALSEALEKEDLSPADVKDKLRHVADEATRTAKHEAKKHQHELREEISPGAGETTGETMPSMEPASFGRMREETTKPEHEQPGQGPSC